MERACRDALDRLDFDGVRAAAILDGADGSLKQILDRPSGVREAYRSWVVDKLVRLWDRGAFAHQEVDRVEQLLKAALTIVAPKINQPRIDYKMVVAKAKEEKEELDKKNKKKEKKQDRKEEKKAKRSKGDSDRAQSRGRSRSRKRDREPSPSRPSRQSGQSRPSGAAFPTRRMVSGARPKSAPPQRIQRRSRSPSTVSPIRVPKPLAPRSPKRSPMNDVVASLRESSPRTRTKMLDTLLEAAKHKPPPSRKKRGVDQTGGGAVGNSPRQEDTTLAAASSADTGSSRHRSGATSSAEAVEARQGLQSSTTPREQTTERAHAALPATQNAEEIQEPPTAEITSAPVQQQAQQAQQVQQQLQLAQPAQAPQTQSVATSSAQAPAPLGTFLDPTQTLDGWEAQRAKRKAVDPDDYLKERLCPEWRPASDQTVELFSFAHPGPTPKDMLWGLFHELAKCPGPGIYVDVLYDDTKWAHKVNAYYGGGSAPVPSIKLEGGGSVNWKRGIDGQLKAEGTLKRVDEILQMLRPVFKPFDKQNPEHSRYTGRTSGKQLSKASKFSAEAAARRERAERMGGKVILAPPGSVLFAQSGSGIWDTLDYCIGCRNVPPYSSIPWKILLNTGALVEVPTSGHIAVTTTKADPYPCDQAEAVLIDKLGAKLVHAAEHKEQHMRVQYGNKSQKVAQRERMAPTFP